MKVVKQLCVKRRRRSMLDRRGQNESFRFCCENLKAGRFRFELLCLIQIIAFSSHLEQCAAVGVAFGSFHDHHRHPRPPTLFLSKKPRHFYNGIATCMVSHCNVARFGRSSKQHCLCCCMRQPHKTDIDAYRTRSAIV